MNICICGGGNLGHVVAGFIAAQGKDRINILTNKPQLWNSALETELPSGEKIYGRLNKVSSYPQDVIPESDIVIICLPGQYIKAEILKIKDYIRKDACVGSIVCNTGFFFYAHEIIKDQKLFGFQRVPFISRISEYGRSSQLLGFKKSLGVCIENIDNKEYFRSVLERLFKTPIILLESFYEVTFSNSNPLLHPSRIYTMWKDWTPGISYENQSMFYEDWTDEASELYVEMDKELQQLLRKLKIPCESIPSVLEYYESSDAHSLTKKIRSIEAFKSIKSPMIKLYPSNRYVPDLSSRYFTEDFELGLYFICKTAKENQMETTTMDIVMEWYERVKMYNAN